MSFMEKRSSEWHQAELTAYIAEQFGGAGEITYKKMFGEYGLYCGGKFFAMVCDDRLFVKITDAILSFSRSELG